MPIHITPLASEFILCYRFTGHITHADLEALHQAETPFFDALPEGRCHSLVADMLRLDTIDASLFPQLQQMRMACDHSVCVVVVVGANPYLRALMISLGLVASTHGFIFRNSLDDALAVLGTRARV